jgi:hypothetical protein
MRGALPSDRGPGRSHCSDRGDEQAARYSRLPPPLALRSARRGAAEGCSHARPLAQTQLVVGDAWFNCAYGSAALAFPSTCGDGAFGAPPSVVGLRHKIYTLTWR